ncbi:Mu transposase domain-containing protein [Streptomyces katrae]|uniref:Mu transposase domain-containing protein n=1 Tax=Streptomyces katrae TaxID=68223 RepID=UPI003AF0D613
MPRVKPDRPYGPPASHGAELEQTRIVSPQGLVSFAGNHYSVPPGLTGARVTVRIRLGGGATCMWSPLAAR